METRDQWAQKLVMEFQSKMEKWHEEMGLKPPWHLGVDSPLQKKAGGLQGARGLLLLSLWLFPFEYPVRKSTGLASYPSLIP